MVLKPYDCTTEPASINQSSTRYCECVHACGWYLCSFCHWSKSQSIEMMPVVVCKYRVVLLSLKNLLLVWCNIYWCTYYSNFLFLSTDEASSVCAYMYVSICKGSSVRLWSGGVHVYGNHYVQYWQRGDGTFILDQGPGQGRLDIIVYLPCIIVCRWEIDSRSRSLM